MLHILQYCLLGLADRDNRSGGRSENQRVFLFRSERLIGENAFWREQCQLWFQAAWFIRDTLLLAGGGGTAWTEHS